MSIEIGGIMIGILVKSKEQNLDLDLGSSKRFTPRLISLALCQCDCSALPFKQLQCNLKYENLHKLPFRTFEVDSHLSASDIAFSVLFFPVDPLSFHLFLTYAHSPHALNLITVIFSWP